MTNSYCPSICSGGLLSRGEEGIEIIISWSSSSRYWDPCPISHYMDTKLGFYSKPTEKSLIGPKNCPIAPVLSMLHNALACYCTNKSWGRLSREKLVLKTFPFEIFERKLVSFLHLYWSENRKWIWGLYKGVLEKSRKFNKRMIWVFENQSPALASL